MRRVILGTYGNGHLGCRLTVRIHAISRDTMEEHDQKNNKTERANHIDNLVVSRIFHHRGYFWIFVVEMFQFELHFSVLLRTVAGIPKRQVSTPVRKIF